MGERRKILVVDDDRDIIELMRKVLESKDFQLSIALDGKGAIEKALEDVPELVLLDLKLPDISGEEVLKRLKEIDKDIAVVVVTGYGGEQVAVDLMRKGAIDFLSKPIETEVLLKSVENALEIRDAQIEDRNLNQYSSLERFFPFFAHEIRNPLHAIQGALTIIRRRSDSKDDFLRQSIKIIEDEVQYLNNFVQECLNFVRPPNYIRFSEIDINEVISVVIDIVSHMFDLFSKRIKITLKKSAGLPKIYANYEEIKQAFLNIIKNSLDAMPNGGELIIKTSHNKNNPGYVQITFNDNGVGISKENMASIFKPFFTTKQRGTGLGLAICKRIITERHRGKIEIESQEEKGTTIRIELPTTHIFGGR